MVVALYVHAALALLCSMFSAIMIYFGVYQLLTGGSPKLTAFCFAVVAFSALTALNMIPVHL